MSFAKAVSDWCGDSRERIEAVHKRSVEMLADEMVRTKPNGGRVPVDTGNLARSLLASTTAMPKTADGKFSGGDVGAVIAAMDVSKPLWLGYQAVYSYRQEFGFVGRDSLGRQYNQAGNYFATGAAAKWQTIVEAALKDVKANAK